MSASLDRVGDEQHGVGPVGDDLDVETGGLVLARAWFPVPGSGSDWGERAVRQHGGARQCRGLGAVKARVLRSPPRAVE